MIDGLNEAVVNGALTPVWRLYLAGLEQEIARYPHLALVTTCRASYQKAIWPSIQPESVMHLSGFEYDDTEKAVRRYFEYYKILGDVTLASLTEFRLPLYLKLFCETKNTSAEYEIPVYVGQETIFDVLTKYMVSANVSVSTRLSKHAQLKLVQNALRKLATELWKQRKRALPIANAYEVVDGRPLEDIDVGKSVMEMMLEEGLLVSRDWGTEEETIGFTYDLLGGYLIADSIISHHGDRLEEFFGDTDCLALLFSQNWQKRHPLADDISRCLAALLPQRASGKYLHELSDDEKAVSDSIVSLFEIAPQSVSLAAVELYLLCSRYRRIVNECLIWQWQRQLTLRIRLTLRSGH